MGFSPEQEERLGQWRNVYGAPEKCVQAAESDARIRSLLEQELALEPVSPASRTSCG
jgi:hypothetical protein